MLFMKSERWILGSLKRDFLAFYLPGFLVSFLLILFGLPENQVLFLFLAWLFFGVLDSGHVYTTVWRTYLDKNEFKRRKIVYTLSPFIFFLAFFFMSIFDFVLLGALVVYATVYHNMRQFYGLTKWYQKINSSFDKKSDFFFYSLTFLSFATLQFRSDLNFGEYYPGANKFFYPNFFLEKIFVFLFFLNLLFWVSYEMFKAYRTKVVEWTRILSVAFPVGLYAFSFMHFKTVATVVFPLVVSHGISYMILILYSAQKTKYGGVSSWKLPAAIVSVAAIFGSAEFLLEDFQIEASFFYFKSALAALILTPLFCHYYFDAFLWKSNHPDFHKIVSESSQL